MIQCKFCSSRTIRGERMSVTGYQNLGNCMYVLCIYIMHVHMHKVCTYQLVY